MKALIYIFSLLFSVTVMAEEATLYIPISSDSGKTIVEINASLAKKKVTQRLPKYAVVTSAMSLVEVQRYLNSFDDLVDKAFKFHAVETKGAYNELVEGRRPCFKGDINKMEDIYNNMVDSFLSDQFTVLAVSVKNPDNFGIKYDESDTGSKGAWINIRRCKK